MQILDTGTSFTSQYATDFVSPAPPAGGYQPMDGDLTAIAALAGTAGLLEKTGDGAWALDTTDYINKAGDTGVGPLSMEALSATTGAFSDAVSITTAGKTVGVKEGANSKMGLATLVGGTVVVSTTAVSANSRILLTPQSLGTILRPTGVGVSARTAGTSFTITSMDATDTSTVAWWIIDPL